MSVAAISLLVSNVDGAAVRARLHCRVAERFGAGVLMGLGGLFFLRAVAEFFDGAAGMAEFGVLVMGLVVFYSLWAVLARGDHDRERLIAKNSPSPN